MSEPRRVLHADADAFFVAVARLMDPDGAGRARYLLVGGSSDHRGVVTSASYETRMFGVRSGMPTAQALRLCPAAVSVPVPRDACVTKSREIRRVLEQFTPVVEAASIDEFYLDLSGTDQLYGGEPLDRIATQIRDAVLDTTGIEVSVGGGSSRLIAKLASRWAKPHGRGSHGVHIVPAGEEAAFMAELDLAAIPGIGPRFQERLAARGLRRVSDAVPLDEATLVSWFGEGSGRWLYRRVRGLDARPVTPRVRSQSLSHETTFAADIDDDGQLDQILVSLVAAVGADLRSKGIRARTLTVKLRDGDFTTRQASRTLPEAVCADDALARTARSLLERLRTRRRVPARLLGVAASQLRRSGETQLSLFDTAEITGLETRRDRAIARAVDTINREYGRRRIVRGSQISTTS